MLDGSQIPTLSLLCLRLQRASADKLHFPVTFAIWLWKALVADWKVGGREKSGDFFPSLCFGKHLKVVTPTLTHGYRSC